MSAENNHSRLLAIVNSPDNPCFVCSQSNPVGLHLRFEAVGQGVRTEFVPARWHQGWADVVHGGILAAVLDETMAYTMFFRGVKAVTARMDVRYRAPVHHNDSLIVEAQVVKESRRLADIEARILRAQQTVVEASGRFVKLGALDLDAPAWGTDQSDSVDGSIRS